jgi:hypothetical protein
VEGKAARLAELTALVMAFRCTTFNSGGEIIGRLDVNGDPSWIDHNIGWLS